MSFDHGILNVPLSKRGNIDREIDRYKAEQYRLEKHQAREAKALSKAKRAEALELIARVSDARFAEIGKPHRMTARQARKKFLSMAGLNAALVIRVLRKELGLESNS